jgi:biopolymer transport protein ExbD
MGRFSKSAKTSSQIPTAALPDIIFILLFFFMVATKPKKMEPLVSTQIASATQIEDIDKDRQQIDLFLGFPKNTAQFGNEPLVEIDGKVIKVKQVSQLIKEQINKLPMSKRNPKEIFVYITVDKGVKQGILYDVKEELKNVGVRSIIYSVKKQQNL